MIPNPPTDELVRKLEENFTVLFRLYRQGLFESKKLELDGHKYDYLPGSKDHEKVVEESYRPPITYAADDLYERAHHLYSKFKMGGRCPNLVWQAMTLSYEINDVYLRVPDKQVEFFSAVARDLADCRESRVEQFIADDEAEVAHDLTDCKVSKAEQIIVSKIARRINDKLIHYGKHLEDPQEKVIYKKLLVLSALAGVNAIIRETKKSHQPGQRQAKRSKAEEAAELAFNLLAYIKHRLPKEHASITDRHQPEKMMPARESYGLLGLCYFEYGRALLLLGGRHVDAERAFVLSTEAYAERLSQKESFWREEIDRLNLKIKNIETLPPEQRAKALNPLEEMKEKETDKYQDRKSVTLRRMALTTAIGSSFLAFTRSHLTRALEGLTIARAVLRENSSIVLRSYAEMIHWQIQRAQHSDNHTILARAKERLEECYEVFSKFTPDRHYQVRCRLELALVCFYLAKTDAENSHSHYQEAFENLNRAEEYFSQEREGNEREERHPHLLSELYILKSHLLRNCLDKDLWIALSAAQTASKYATNLRQYKCEALLAVAAAHESLAKEYYDRGTREEYESHFRETLASVGQALSANTDNNARVKAVSYLRLARLYLIEPDKTYHEAQRHFTNWLGVKDLVEHKFCHVHAVAVERALENDPRKLVVDFTKSMNKERWKNDVEELFIKTCLNRVVERINVNKTLPKDRKALKSEIARFLQELKEEERVKHPHEYVRDGEEYITHPALEFVKRPSEYIEHNELVRKLAHKLNIDYSSLPETAPPSLEKKPRRHRRKR